MYCSKCGMENPEDQKICISCSQPLPVEPDLPPPMPAAKTSTLAIWSFVLAILGLFTFMITALPALICGIISLVKISKSNGRLKGKGYAITGIVTPFVYLVLICFLGILMAILMPALGRAKQVSQTIMCSTNLKQFGVAIQIYTKDYNDTYPPADKWCDALKTYLPVSLYCPVDAKKEEGKSSYAFNINLSERKPSEVPPDTVLLFETTIAYNPAGGPELLIIEKHRNEGSNVLFADGHVKFVKKEDLPSLRWKPD